MKIKDLVLAFLVVLIWGVNFIVIKIGVTGMPPFLLAGIRFIVIVALAIFFVKRPNVSFKLLLVYGLSISFAHFSLLYTAIHLGMPAGIASLVIQAQAFFTILLGTMFGEKLKWNHIVGIIVAIVGIYFVGTGAVLPQGAKGITAFTMFLTLSAAFCWATGNITTKVIMKKDPNINGLSLVTWGALIPIIPFFICSFIFEGKQVIVESLLNIHLSTVLAIIYMAVVSSIVGFVIWSDLMSKYDAWKVAPLGLLVPVISLIAGAIVFSETVDFWQIIGAALVLSGLFINMVGGNIKSFITYFSNRKSQPRISPRV